MSRTWLRNAAVTPTATNRSLRPEVPGRQIDHAFFRNPLDASVSTATKLHFEEKVALDDGRTICASEHFGVEASIDFELPDRRSQTV
jgi:hypothetical protein